MSYDPQKFQRGDLVRIAKDLGPSMSHFESDCNAVVIGSYDDQYGASDDDHGEHIYELHIEGGGRVSWHPEKGLRLVEAGRLDLLNEWRTEEFRRRRERGER